MTLHFPSDVALNNPGTCINSEITGQDSGRSPSKVASKMETGEITQFAFPLKPVVFRRTI